ncbi:striatin-like isoform X5 [Electrophorus electricus]|uniref:striatin-like isoform X5 n=1 Tax=Electrophorus electricus TaxID=8005 RepID=UPI0015CFB0E6|nr:striatin-like isoform X5 [Electrophorus electricus]
MQLSRMTLEAQAQVAFLHGERKGQENLKKDLVRRIKMLEYALKQERAKYHKLKYGTELNLGDVKPPSYDSDEANEKEFPGSLNNQFCWKQGRQLLRQYLQEVGYTDTILDVKSQRVKALLGLAGDRAGQEPLLNGTDTSPRGASTAVKVELTDSSSVLEALKFIERAAAEFSDGEDEEEGEEKPMIDSRTIMRKKPLSSSSLPAHTPDRHASADPDADDVLKGFDFLSSTEDMDVSPECRSAGDGRDWEKETQQQSEAWNVDQGLIAKLKEKYKQERRGKKGAKRPNRSKLQDMLSNLRDTDEAVLLQPPATPPVRPNTSRFSEHDGSRTDEGPLRLHPQTHARPPTTNPAIRLEAVTFPPPSDKAFIMVPEDVMETGELGLGELAGLTVANEADSLAYEIGNNKDALRKTWNPKYTLRSHFDAVRSLVFHPTEPVLITASEDHTLKMWNLQKTTPTKKNTSLDVEPIYTFRAHRGAVLCVVMNNTGERCYSGGVDGTIQCWNTPGSSIDPYDSYQSSVLRGALCGHADAVWGLVHSSAHQRLLSCSADGTVRLWNASSTQPALAIFNESKELGLPSSVDLVCSDPAYMVTSFNTGQIGLFNMETRQLVLSLESIVEPGASCQINKVLSHPTLPITISAQEDRHIKFYDNNTGKLIHSMVAHLDAVTSLAVDPNGLYLMSGSHDCSIRLWNLENKTCVQEFTAHRKKFEESIHDVAFHPSKCYIASAGADSLAKVFV